MCRGGDEGDICGAGLLEISGSGAGISSGGGPQPPDLVPPPGPVVVCGKIRA